MINPGLVDTRGFLDLNLDEPIPKNFNTASTKEKKASPIILTILNAISPIPAKPLKNEAKSPSNILSIFEIFRFK